MRPALLVLLAACGGGSGDETTADASLPASSGNIEILSPEGGDTLSPEVTVLGRALGDSVRVNGVATPVASGEFETVITLEPGPQQIVVEGDGGARATVDVVIDGENPLVTITSPELGSFIEGDRLVVTGQVTDGSDVTVTVEDEPVALDAEGRFSFEREVDPGAHRLRVLAEDVAGNRGSAAVAAVVGRFGPEGELVSRAVEMAVGRPGLDVLEEVVAELLEPGLIAQRLRGRRVVERRLYDVIVRGYRHRSASLALTPMDGQLQVRVILERVRVPIEVDALVDLDGEARAERVRLDGTVAIDMGEDGVPRIRLTDRAVRMPGFEIDIDGLPGFVDEGLITRAVKGTVEESIEAEVADAVPGGLEAALNFVNAERTVSFLTREVTFASRLAALSAFDAGLSAALDFGLVVGEDRALDGPGPLVLPTEAPEMEGSVPLEVAVSVDVLNAAAYDVWSTRGLYLDFEMFAMEGGFLDLRTLERVLPDQELDEDTPLGVEILAALPPVVTPTDGGQLQIVVPDIRLALFAAGADEPLRTLTAALTATLEARAGDDRITLEVVDPQIVVDPADGLGPFAGTPQQIDSGLDRILYPLLAPTAEGLGFGVPSFAGLTAVPRDIATDGGYLKFEGQLQAAGP